MLRPFFVGVVLLRGDSVSSFTGAQQRHAHHYRSVRQVDQAASAVY
jgi:hypothetical protein